MGRFFRRLAPLSGLAFAGVIIVAFVTGGSTPDSDAPGAEVISYYQRHHNAQVATAFLLAYAALLGLVFAASLRSYLRARSSSDSVIAFGFVGYVLFAVGLGKFSGLTFTLTDSPGKLDPAAAQALNFLGSDMFVIFLMGMAAFMLGSGLAVALTGALPRWIGWVGFVIGIVALTPVGWFALFGLLGWSIVVSVLMFIREGKAETKPEASPAPA